MKLTLAGHEGTPDVAISPDGRLLATLDGRTIRIWRSSNGNLVTSYVELPMEVPPLFVRDVEFVDDDTILYRTPTPTVRSRNLTTGQIVFDVPVVSWSSAARYSRSTALAYSKAAELFAVGGFWGHVEIRSARTGELVTPVVTDPIPAARIALSPDATRLVIGAWSINERRVLDAGTGSQVATIVVPRVAAPLPREITDISDLPDPDLADPPYAVGIAEAVFSADSLHVYGACTDGRVRKWDAATGVELASFDVGGGFKAVSLAVFGDGERAVCGLSDKSARVIRLSDGTEIAALQGHPTWVFGVAVDPAGTTIATGDQGGLIKLWNAESGTLLRELPRHNPIMRLDFSADGSRLASAGSQGLVKIWNVSDGTLLHELGEARVGPTGFPRAWSAKFSPDGSKLVGVFAREVSFWNAIDGSVIDWTVSESIDAMDAVWFGDKIAFGRRDGTVLVVSVPQEEK